MIMRLTLSLKSTAGAEPGAGTARAWQRQVVCTLTARRGSPVDVTAQDHALPDPPHPGDFRRYLASFLSHASYREFL